MYLNICFLVTDPKVVDIHVYGVVGLYDTLVYVISHTIYLYLDGPCKR